MTIEEWKNIEGYPNYQVSNLGDVKSFGCYVKTKNGGHYFRKGKILSDCYGSSGYSIVILRNAQGKKSFSRHRLVAKAFIPNPDNLPQVNHINGDKTKNSASNLEWITASENIQHAYDNGIRKDRKGIMMFDKFGNLLRKFNSGNEVQKTMNIYRSGVCEAAQGKKSGIGGHEYKGYVWRYA